MSLNQHTHVMTALVACSFVVCAHASLRTDLTPQVKQLQTLTSNNTRPLHESNIGVFLC